MNPPICPECDEPIVDMLEAYFDTYTGRVRHWPEAHRSTGESPMDQELIVTALVSALTVFAGDADYAAEEQLVRQALDELGAIAVNSAGEPI